MRLRVRVETPARDGDNKIEIAGHFPNHFGRNRPFAQRIGREHPVVAQDIDESGRAAGIGIHRLESLVGKHLRIPPATSMRRAMYSRHSAKLSGSR